MELSADLVIADRFRLVRQLGQGGMGAVWLAHHIGLDVPCAIKFINEEAAQSEEHRARFVREAKSAAQLRTAHVVNILDHGVWRDIPYIAMEYLEGEDLRQRLNRVRILAPSETVSIASQVCRALTKAHAIGLVHRDLKPANIFLVKDDDREVAKVLDFGVAKVKDLSVDGNTKSGAILGTPQYMSPEQATGSKDVDHRSDLWALAVVVFRCLTGRLPFQGTALGDLFVNIIVSPIAVPSTIATVPPDFDAWWARAVARPPEARFQTPREFSEALALALGVTQTGDLGAMSGRSGRDSAVFSSTPSINPSALPTRVLDAPAMESGGAVAAQPARPLLPSVAPTPLQQSISLLPPPRRRGARAMGAIGVVLGGGLAAGVALFALRSPSPPAPAQSSGVVGAASVATAKPVEPGPATTPTATADPEVTAAPVASGTPSATPAAPIAKKAAAPPTTAKPRVNCDPNFYLDGDGQKHFKPECFK